MSLPVVIIVVAILLVVAFIAGGAYKYSSLFAPKHICEFATGIAQLKRAALASIIQPGEEYEARRFDHNTLVTGAGLGVMYTISMQKDLFCHHISISHQTSSLAHSAAMTFATWVSYILNVPAEKISVPIGASSLPGDVWHVTFELTADEEAAYKASEPQVVDQKTVTDSLWKQIAPRREIIMQASLPNAAPRQLPGSSESQ
ncbi:MAG TPA: hypothetical protein V6C81_24025 [Planktothrix sp.]|jgi:hypothetical protein